jgi:hypothetical protein
MKKIHLFTTLMILITSLASCQTIVDLHDNSNPINTPNTYYKDIGNKLNPYEGTWIFNDGTSYIKIVMVKKIKFSVWQYFEDCLVGGFQYKKNGAEIINTLNLINSNFNDPIKYPIYGNRFRYRQNGPFSNYTTNNERIRLSFEENGCYSNIDVRTLTLNGQPSIQISKGKALEIGQVCTPIIPEGFYYLKKQ